MIGGGKGQRVTPEDSEPRLAHTNFVACARAYLLQEHDGAAGPRGRPDVRRNRRRHGPLAPHTTDENDEGPHTLHLQAPRELQKHLRR